jgi:MraZ protein
VLILRGEYQITMDQKNRILLPKDFKKQFLKEDTAPFILARGFQKCIRIYPLESWNKLSAKFDNLNSFQPEVESFIMRMYRGLTEVNADSAGRLVLPPTLIAYAGLVKDCTIVAKQDHAELWDNVKLDAYFEELEKTPIGDLSKQISQPEFLNPFGSK